MEATARLVRNESVATLDEDRDRNDAGRQFHPWISESLFAETRRVWSLAHGRILDDGEVTEILVNVRRLTETLLTAALKGETHERGDLGSRIVA
jgi:hypothetical protein